MLYLRPVIQLHSTSTYWLLIKRAPAILTCWCFFILTGCKDPAIEDKDLLNSDDNINLAKDTLHFKVQTLAETNLASNGVSIGLVGNLTDPVFGTTVAGFYGQPRITSNNISFGENPVLDEVYLSLVYSGKYGNFDQPVDLNVYELSQSLIDSVKYYTNSSFAVNTPPIGQVTGFVPNITDSVEVWGTKYVPHLRVKLSNAFGNKILTADTNALRDLTSFLSLFKGFYITTSSSTVGNGAVYFDIRNAISGITLYYHNDNQGDSLAYTIPITGVTVQHTDNNYSGTQVQTALSSPNPAGDEKVFIQSGAGTFGKLEITDLDSLPKNISINKAELILTQSPGDTSFLAPLLLDLYRIDDAGQLQKLEDDGLSHFGGVRVSETIDGQTLNRYHFVITTYFQKLLNATYRNNGFYLKTLSANTNTERVAIANSPTDKKLQVTLLITYTKL